MASIGESNDSLNWERITQAGTMVPVVIALVLFGLAYWTFQHPLLPSTMARGMLGVGFYPLVFSVIGVVLLWFAYQSVTEAENQGARAGSTPS